MSLLTTKVTPTKTLQNLLDDTNTHYSIIGKPDELVSFLNSHKANHPDLTSEDTLNEIQFVQFLTKRYGTNNPFCEVYQWEPDEKIERETLDELKENARIKGTSFEDEFEEFIVEVLLDWNGDFDVINDFYEESDIDEDDDFYIDLFWEYADCDYGIQQILKQSQTEQS